MAVTMHKAERRKAKLRIGLFGPAGSGKSMSALKIGHGMAPWEKICVIDTENGSADLYSHLGPYNVITISPPYSPEKYVEAIKEAERQGMLVIILDSITHEWQGTGGILELADTLSATMRDGRQVWTKLTPRHNRFIDAILQSPAHTIACGRSKQEVVMTEKESNGRTVKIPEKMGLKAITREGFEYEMTVTFDLAINHFATCSKDRTKGEDGLALFQDRPARLIDEEVGRMLRKWSDEGTVDMDALKIRVWNELRRLGFSIPADKVDGAAYSRDAVRNLTGLELKDENLDPIIEALSAYPQAFTVDAIYKLMSRPAGTKAEDKPIDPPKPPETGGNADAGTAQDAPQPPKEGSGEAGAVESAPKGPVEPEADDFMGRAWACKTLPDARKIIEDATAAQESAGRIAALRGTLLSKGYDTNA